MRHLSARLFSRRSWRRRLVFWCGALLVGAVSVAFARAADWSQEAFAALNGGGTLLPLLITPLGFGLCALLTRTVFPGAQGSGIPQAIAARRLRDDDSRRQLLSPKLILGKILLTLVGLMSGASIGREGPTVQVGASIMLGTARFGGLQHQRGLILAGSAAGIAAAFNTPLAGIVFAIEEMSRSFEQRANGLALYAVIIAGLASLALVGNYTYFGSVSGSIDTASGWLLVVLCGLAGGLLGGVFSRLLVRSSRILRSLTTPSPFWRGGAIAAGCGLLVALIGLVTDGATFGTGYGVARSAIEGEAAGGWYWAAKLVSTLVSAVSGIPGGIFAPSLSVGAGLGSAIASTVGNDQLALAAALGMAGYFAGVCQAPLTAFVIVIEMTSGGTSILPLMAASVLGFATSKLIAVEPLYHALARDFERALRHHQPGPSHS